MNISKSLRRLSFAPTLQQLEVRQLMAGDVAIESPHSDISHSTSADWFDGTDLGQHLPDEHDVNGDGRVSALDALIVINRLDEPEAVINNDLPFLDVNGDGILTADDAEQVIERLSRNAPSTSFAETVDAAIDGLIQTFETQDAVPPVIATTDPDAALSNRRHFWDESPLLLTNETGVLLNPVPGNASQVTKHPTQPNSIHDGMDDQSDSDNENKDDVNQPIVENLLSPSLNAMP